MLKVSYHGTTYLPRKFRGQSHEGMFSPIFLIAHQASGLYSEGIRSQKADEGRDEFKRDNSALNIHQFKMEGNIVKAIVCSVHNGPYEIKDVRIGAISDDEIAVRMVATGICHTDFACTTVN